MTRLAPARFSLSVGVLRFGPADDEEIRPHDPRAQHRVDIFRVRPDGRNQSARPLDPDPLQHILAAGVGFDAERAFGDRQLHPFRAVLDDHVRNLLPPEWRATMLPMRP